MEKLGNKQSRIVEIVDKDKVFTSGNMGESIRART